MGSDVVGLVALDFVLGIVGRGAMGVALIVEVRSVDFDDSAADVSGFGVPADVIADGKALWARGGFAGAFGGYDQELLQRVKLAVTLNRARAAAAADRRGDVRERGERLPDP